MANFLGNFFQRLLVKPSRINSWIGQAGYWVHSATNNYNFEMDENGEKRLMEAVAPCDIKTVFDVGAYKGHWSLAAIPIVHPEVVHAFEPVPRSFGKLTRNLGDKTIASLHQLALGNGPDTFQIIFNAEKPTRSGFHARTRKYEGLEIIDVEVIDGAGFCDANNIKIIDLLKIDAEGHEKHVLAGFEPMLEAGAIRAIQFEYSPVGTIYDVSLWELYELFETHGYVVGKIFPEGVAFAPFDSLKETVLGPNYCAILASETEMVKNAMAPRRCDFNYLKDKNSSISN